MEVFLNRIATAVPPHEVHGKFVAVAPALLPDERSRRLFLRMAERSQIERRWSFFVPDPGDGIDADGFFRRGAFPDTGRRMAFYERHAPELAFEAVARLEPGRVSHVVVASCTGFYAPGLDAQIAARLGPGIERTVVGFMGCQAALNALKLARHIVRSEPAARVLVVAVELCTLHLQDSQDLETVLSFLLFGDGCAAGLVSAEPGGIALDGFASAMLPDTGGLITWRIGGFGFDMHLSGQVPAALAAGLPGFLPNPAEIELWAVHPGGRTVLDAVAQAVGRDPLDSRTVLREFGNMSSPTVLFVLDRMLRRGATGHGCALAFGPGLSAESMLFRIG